ncbi:alkaline phosphatase family protein [Mycobacterium sp. pV006]|uniref:alkaline phosphatase family protein n=1 Tax=Mycobacterium sp. pV006 TaxID=3238983 RepID=UPI00351ACCB9
MDHAKYIGRIGALAVTLGVGVALGSVPSVAFADTGSSDTGSATSDSSQQRDTSAARERTSSSDTTDRRSERRESRTEERTTSTREQQRSAGDTDEAGEDAVITRAQSRTAAVADADADEPAQERPAAEVRDDPPSAPVEPAAHSAVAPEQEVTDPVTVAPPPTRTTTIAPQRRAPKSAPTRERATLASSFVSALLSPTAGPGRGTPLQAPVMVAAMGAVRDELERNAALRAANDVAGQVNAQAIAENVLVIGVDGVNLRRVLTNPDMTHFLSLIGDSTTAPASIVGHTTVSNPSWTSILTGVWGERTGVINNVFTPWTYDKFPTVFELIETQDASIQTISIANWNVISAIADTGTLGADLVINVNQEPDDPDWLATDDAVGQATVAQIAGANLAVPNFLFSYFVGVDENGHTYGGASEEYEIALENFDKNLGLILAQIAASPEPWTILMVTDHGHQPQKGLGHGFQSPDETSTFVVAYNHPAFTSGAMNLQYEIVDVTPTVLSLFGLDSPDGFDGSSMLGKGGTVVPVGPDPDAALNEALIDAIDKYGYPDIGTQIALGARTIAGFIPYYVQNLSVSLTSGLQAIADMEIFLVSLIAEVAIAPVRLLTDVLYVATNIVAQIVARLTGVTGASIFPLWPPAPPPTVFTPDAPGDTGTALLCGTVEMLTCGPATVAV